MSLEPKDLEAVERILYRCADDIAISVDRSIERLEGRMDDAETRITSRISDLEDDVEECKRFVVDALEAIREELHVTERV